MLDAYAPRLPDEAERGVGFQVCGVWKYSEREVQIWWAGGVSTSSLHLHCKAIGTSEPGLGWLEVGS